MTISMYAASVPVFKQILGGLSGVLTKAEQHAQEKKIEPAALLQAHLFPDMFKLIRQVQIATDFAKGVSARLVGADVPSYPDTEQTFEQLQARIATTLNFISQIKPADIDGSEERRIVTQAGTPKEKIFTGQSYLLNYGLPHFFFHVTTAYAILRHSGVPIGKKDYIGTY